MLTALESALTVTLLSVIAASALEVPIPIAPLAEVTVTSLPEITIFLTYSWKSPSYGEALIAVIP